MNRPCARLGLLLALGLSAACGRSWVYDYVTPPIPKPCSLELKPASIDYGLVGVGTAVQGRVLLWNGGGTTCEVTQVALGEGTDPDFELPAAQATSLSIEPGEDASLNVDFDAESLNPPTTHTGTLTFQTGDATHPSATVPLTATVHTVCTLSVTPASIDYGTVPIGSSATQSATLTNVGSAVCDVSQIEIASGSDPEFTLTGGQALSLSIQVGASATVPVTFTATDRTPPHKKTGKLTLKTGDPANPTATVPLTANVDVGCELTISPNPLDFGNLTLNQTSTAPVTLTNTGTQACTVAQIQLGAGTDIDFTLPSQPTFFTITVGGNAQIQVTFDAANPPPNRRNGTLTFVSNDTANLNVSVPLTGYIDTNCTSAGLLIYVVDNNNTFSTFNPENLTFKDLGTLSCPDNGGTPFSMAVDQNAIAWVLFSDGNIFRVDPATLDCTPTTFVPDQSGLKQFGMGFSFDTESNTDTLFIAGGTSLTGGTAELATVSFPSLTVSTVAPLTEGWPELTGTGDGQLWGFFPTDTGAGFNNQAEMVQIDKQSGAPLQTWPLPAISGPQFSATAWAVGFFGGAFWPFLAANGGTTTVYEVQRSTGVLTTALPNTGRNIVGAGVSTCAPVN
jgi:hypothetical protein